VIRNGKKKLIYVGNDVEMRARISEMIMGSEMILSFLPGNDALAAKIAGSSFPDHDICCILGAHSKTEPSGEELVRLVRSGSYKSVPALLHVEQIERETAQALIQLGVDGILCAPFSRGTLLSQIQNAVARRESLEMQEIMGGSNLLAS